MGSDEVTIEAAPAASELLLANLMELYLHDLSEVFPIALGADGRFGYPKLPLYWTEPGRRFPFLLRSGGEIAGFALVTRGSPASDDPEALDVAEFFVLRPHRRAHVGRRAAARLWDLMPGSWVVRVAETNHAAIPFWHRAVNDYTRGAFTTHQHRGEHALFRVYRFHAPHAGQKALDPDPERRPAR